MQKGIENWQLLTIEIRLYNCAMANEKNVISASRRCDIPAFQTEWFLESYEAGFCEVTNPFNPRQISRISLKPEHVTAFIFWTRNPSPFWPAIELLLKQKVPFGFMLTINGYGKEIEPMVPDWQAAVASAEMLAQTIGPEKIIWRYDPIIISNFTDFAWHLRKFSQLAARLNGKVNGCIISLIDYYRKTRRNLAKLPISFNEHPETLPDFGGFLSNLQAAAGAQGIKLGSCCETDQAFSRAGISNTGCINPEWLQKITGYPVKLPKHKGQRPGCQCVVSKDIGAYDTCKHGCLYCYAGR